MRVSNGRPPIRWSPPLVGPTSALTPSRAQGSTRYRHRPIAGRASIRAANASPPGSSPGAGLIDIADEMAGRDLGYLNTALYNLAANSATYAADFHDNDTNSNAQSTPDSGTSGNCCPSSQGWDAVTGLGSPNAATLLPDLIAATAGS